ncbi:MAG: thrZ [Candidatus Magasanikbacteria bacterium]|nr:thrZ [Candidatus Magasanikbacteria bacterium]
MHPIEIQRHSAAHLVAAAVMELYPESLLGIGPVVENGFFYDIEFGTPVSEADLKAIEARAQHLQKQDQKFIREELPIDEAIALFSKMGQGYKVELLQDLKTRGTTKMSADELQDVGGAVDQVSIYRTGDFVDLCRGPHVEHSRQIGPFTLNKLAGAYWRGKEGNPQLQRIYGVCFATPKELADYLFMIEEAKKRDHRKIGRELGLFVFSDLVGPGLPLFTHKGMRLRTAIQNFVRELQEPLGYEEVWTPHLTRMDLYVVSGHAAKFTDDLFRIPSSSTHGTPAAGEVAASKENDESESAEYAVKPMNCPHHTQIYKSETRSYRDLPFRTADFSTLYRNEKPGQLQGLTRVRSLTQDDAHAFIREDQIENEVSLVLGLIKKILDTFALSFRVRLSLRDPLTPEKYLGGEAVWNKAEAVLEGLLKKFALPFEAVRGEAAFYGPKMDFMARDSLGREWQLSTIQLDFNLPERFDLKYVDAEGKEMRPVMIHRALTGSVERFLGIIIEHYAGAFPVWLAPVQVKILPVADRHQDFAVSLGTRLRGRGVRFEVDGSKETVGKKIRNAEKEKVPYMLVVGDKEMDGGALTVRRRGEPEQFTKSFAEFVEGVAAEIKERT